MAPNGSDAQNSRRAKKCKNIAGQTGILPPKVVLLIETDPKKSFNLKKPNMKKTSTTPADTRMRVSDKQL